MSVHITVGKRAFELGGLISEGKVPESGPPLCRELAGKPQTATDTRWIGFLNPCQVQVGPSCGGNALANAVEFLLRATMPEQELHAKVQGKLGHLRWQIDGERLWSQARQRRYGHLHGGLRMDDIVEEFVESTLIPGATIRIIGVGMSVLDVISDMTLCAVILGLAVAPSWEKPEPNGYIRPAQPWPNAGHAVMMPKGMVVQDGNRYVVIQNSWGSGWAWNGLGILHEKYMMYSMLDYAVAICPPSGEWWKKSPWLDYVVAHKG